jgi:hypothetical protein
MLNRHRMWACVLVAQLAACGGASETPQAASGPESSSTAQRAQLPGAPDSDRARRIASAHVLMDFGESRFPQFFPIHPPDRYAPPFLYRVYADAKGRLTYLGVVIDGATPFTLDGVYVLGGSFGNAPQFVGPLSAFVAPLSDTQQNTTPAPVDAYVGTWRNCDSSFLGMFSLRELVTFTKVNDKELLIESLSTRHDGNFCQGAGDGEHERHVIATWFFQGQANNGGTLMDKFILVNSQDSVGAEKIAVALSNDVFNIARFIDKDADGYPTALDTVFPRPYLRQ